MTTTRPTTARRSKSTADPSSRCTPPTSPSLASKRVAGSITGLTSALDEQIDPVFFKASTDFGQPRPEYFDGSFPAELANVRSFHADGQDQQQLLLAVGQFRGSGDTANTGKQRRHTRVETEIYYGQPDPAIRDLTPPSIDSSRGYVDDKVVYFEVEASDVGGKVERVYVLYRDENKAGRWTGVDLALAGGVWRGGRAFIGERVEFAVQAVDSSGNVAMSDAKSLFFLTAPPTESGELQLSVTSPEKPSDSGWYSTDVVAKVTGGDGSKIQYSIDGDVFADYTSDGIAVTENGGHVVTAIDGTGIAVLYVAIDKLAPSAFFLGARWLGRWRSEGRRRVRRRRRLRREDHRCLHQQRRSGHEWLDRNETHVLISACRRSG